jgi:thiol:disulfide interchange protein DsbD
MVRLRQVLAVPMYATALWLLWVLAGETGRPGLLAGLAGLILVAAAAFAFGRTQASKPLPRRGGAALAAACLLGALALLPGIDAPAAAGEPAVFLPGAQPFTAARLAAFRSQGRPVLVDMTAAWCLTCLVNEHVALESAAVRQAIRARDVALLVGDWTRQDPALSTFLKAHGRDGVPLYLYYPAHAAAPVTLPQILTAGTVVSALNG